MACARTIRNFFSRLGLFVFAVVLVAPTVSPADPLSASLSVDTSGGFARLVFTFSDEVDATVSTAGQVLIINFGQPVTVSVDRIATQAPDYVSTARRDPDGAAVRLALAHKLKVNTILAGEKFFVDLLPEDWSGLPPSLPQDVIAELARRAREAERLERLARQKTPQKKPEAVVVRVASQPTFTRYVFDIPEQTTVSADSGKDGLTLTFDSPILFDIADAEAALPTSIAAINTDIEQGSTLVHFGFLSKVDVRSFRDGKSYDVDIVNPDPNADEHHDAGAVLPNFTIKPTSSDKPRTDGALPTPGLEASAAAANKPQVAAPATIVAQSPDVAMAKPAPATPMPATPAAPIPAPAPPAPGDAVPAAAMPMPSASTPQDKGGAPTLAPEAVAPPPQPPFGNADASAPPAKTPPSSARREANDGDKVAVELSRQGASLKLSFPFMAPTAAAIFRRTDTLWLVFDTKSDIDLSALDGEPSRTVRSAEFMRAGDAAVVRVRLDHPHLSSAGTEGAGWVVTIGDAVLDPTHALEVARNMIGPNRASVTVTFEEPHHVHRIRDPEVNDDLLVVTGFAPTRGFINEQDFVEFRALASTQGVAVEPLADDLTVDLAADKIVVSRPSGLTLSSTLQSVLRSSALRPLMFDSQLWGFDRQATYEERQSRLMAAAAAAPEKKRLVPRLDLARFYIARDMYTEAKGVLDVALAEEHPAAEEISANILRAVAEVMMDRPGAALKDLSSPGIGDQHDAPLWRAMAYADQGKWGQARDAFKSAEAAIATLPVELQRVVLRDELRAAIEVHDFAGAGDHLNDFETIGVPREQQPALSVLVGRLYEGMGRSEDALTAYQLAADSWDRPAAAQGRLRETALRYALGDLKRPDAISELEALTTVWRGDDTEVEALELLARLYAEAGRYRDSFSVMRSAVAAEPDSDITRRIQEDAATTFDKLFLGHDGDALPPVEALALFYDFRELTPIGRRGDEMIRRLADRLVSVDLLDQAAELLQYQVDRRLQGAARAQVATRLAVVYLMNRKADRALATLRATRTSDLATELRNQRLLLEGRALSDLGRYDLALEVVAHIEGRETIRLRSDILWAARRWGPAAEQLELYYGDRWKDWQLLNEIERADILRAAIGYALADDALGLERFREKYAAKMAQTPDARAFEIVSAPLGTSGTEFRNIAHAATAADTLENFLRDMQARYPDAPLAAAPAAGGPDSANALKAAPPAGGPSGAGSTTPISAPPAPPARDAGRTAQR